MSEMAFESMAMRDLQEECKRRGLPSGRNKTELVKRLTDHDATTSDAPVPDVPSEVLNLVEDDTSTAPKGPPADTAGAKDTAVAPGPAEDIPARPSAFRMTFPAGPEGPGDEEHLVYRQSTSRAAIDAGLTPRGDARRVGTFDGNEVYEVTVRQVT